MFTHKICKIVLISLIFVNYNIQIMASSIQHQPLQRRTVTKLYKFENPLKKFFQKRNTNKFNGKPQSSKEISKPFWNEDINKKFSFIEDELTDYHAKCPNDKTFKMKKVYYLSEPFSGNEDYYDTSYIENENGNTNLDYKNHDNNNDKIFDNGLIYRREVPNINIRNIENSSLYPSVLTKALEISLDPSASGVLANVAEKLNTSTLDLAKKLTKTKKFQSNDQIEKIIQSYLVNKAIPSVSTSNQLLTTNKVNPVENLSLRPEQIIEGNRLYNKNADHLEDITTSSLTEILERVLNKLEDLQDSKNDNNKDHPDGAPCDIIGSWRSNILGLCFEIQLERDKMRNISPTEINNKMLTINAKECTPPKHHEIIDLDWKFTGSALKQWGGPIYSYGQKRSESIVATFLGFCRTCGGIDTIFGSWNFILPSKDCNDISLAFETKRDVLTRIRMEMKRKERFKNLLYQSRLGKT